MLIVLQLPLMKDIQTCYIYKYTERLPTKDPNTDVSACIPYRLYGDGAEAHRILTAYTCQYSLQSTPNTFLTQASKNLRCLLCSSPAVLLQRLWRTAFCTMAEVAEVFLKASVVVPYHGCYFYLFFHAREVEHNECYICQKCCSHKNLGGGGLELQCIGNPNKHIVLVSFGTTKD